MDQQQIKKIGFDSILIITIFLYSQLLGVSLAFLVFEFIFAIPIIIYVYKRGVNSVLLGVGLLTFVLHTFMFGYFSALVVLAMFILPSLLIGKLIRQKNGLSTTILFVTLYYFVNIILIIFLYNQFNQVDIIENYFQAIDYATEQNVALIEEMLERTYGAETQEYIRYIYQAADTFKHYYITMIFIGVLSLVFLQSLLARILLNTLGWHSFKAKRIIEYTPPRSFLFFFIIFYFLQDSIRNIQLQITVNNLLAICMIVLLVVGFLFEVFLIYKTRSIPLKILLVLISVICIIVFPTYFVGIGILEILLRFRSKMNKI